MTSYQFFCVCVCFYCEVCREDKAGRGYLGQVNTTVSGLHCQPWSSTTPHVPEPSYTDNKFSDGSRAEAENYCRNPDPSWFEGVWCYTMDQDVPWEICDVPECGNINKCLMTSLLFRFSKCVALLGCTRIHITMVIKNDFCCFLRVIDI